MARSPVPHEVAPGQGHEVLWFAPERPVEGGGTVYVRPETPRPMADAADPESVPAAG